VEVGIAAAVCVEAALTVCAMKVLIAAGSGGGNGVASDGTQAKTIPTTVNQMISLALCVNIFPLAHPKPRPEATLKFFIGSIRLFGTDPFYHFSTMIAA
jgi:hypothetical protein